MRMHTVTTSSLRPTCRRSRRCRRPDRLSSEVPEEVRRRRYCRRFSSDAWLNDTWHLGSLSLSTLIIDGIVSLHHLLLHPVLVVVVAR